MKRAFQLIAVLVAALLLVDTAGAGAANRLVVPVSSKGSLKKSKKTSSIKVSGTLKAPKQSNGCAPGRYGAAPYCVALNLCTGKVRITIKRGKTTIYRKSATLSAACTYKASAKFKRTGAVSKRKARGKLAISATFLGNTFISSKSASKKSLRAPKKG